jgi:hypothetical protein
MTTARRTPYLLLALAGVWATAACTSEPDIPKATGPSELGLSLQVLASPDVLNTDGLSTSQITVTARGPNSEPKAGVPLRADIRVGGAIVDLGSLSSKSTTTGSDGRATIVYTAPPGGLAGNADGGNVVQVGFTPLSGDYANAVERAVSIRLVPLGSIVFPGQPAANFTWRPTQPFAMDEVTLDAGQSKDCPLTAAAPTDCFDSPTLQYEWNMDDRNIILAGRVIKYQFPQRGDYFVKLTVTNALGNKVSVTKQIDVLARP